MKAAGALRLALLGLVPMLLGACTKTGLNAGKQGGLAWVGMAGMLIATAVILWFFLGREE